MLLKTKLYISCYVISLFSILGEESYASEQLVSKVKIEIPTTPTTVRGRVVDEKGEPLVGATIRQKGGKNGAVTDINGNFLMSVPDNAILQVSFIGYESVEVAVGGKSTLEIRLREDTVVLDNVIVTALGLEKDEATLAYSAQKIKGRN